MKPTSDNALSCAVFGHNYVKSETSPKSSTELKCCNCGTVTHTDSKGNFIETKIASEEIQSTLRELYHLRLRLSRLILSS
ncbi:hypothetical protein [Winogradskyella sp.]|uniref:hypothetical protein n=1 Tax=Winogradskyella sp. TaxID=1883156 RepID=UPI003F6D8360